MAKNKPSKKAVWDALKAPVDNRTPNEIIQDTLAQILSEEIRVAIDKKVVDSMIDSLLKIKYQPRAIERDRFK